MKALGAWKNGTHVFAPSKYPAPSLNKLKANSFPYILPPNSFLSAYFPLLLLRFVSNQPPVSEAAGCAFRLPQRWRYKPLVRLEERQALQCHPVFLYSG